VGLRKLLSRRPAEDPLEHFAELGREQAEHPPRQFPRATTESSAAPVSVAAVDKKPPLQRRRLVLFANDLLDALPREASPGNKNDGGAVRSPIVLPASQTAGGLLVLLP
jgi:hypothetical protein